MTYVTHPKMVTHDSVTHFHLCFGPETLQTDNLRDETIRKSVLSCHKPTTDRMCSP